MPKLPRKQEGDTLSAKHINTLSRSAEMVLGPGMGMFGSQFGGKFSGLPPHAQRVAIITDDAEDPIFEFRLRYFDSEDTTDTPEGSWKTNEDAGPYYVDANALGSSFAVDDKIIVWWDQQRNMWLPAGGGGGGGDWLVEIDSLVDGCGCKVAECTVIRTPCGNRKYAIGDTVIVYDDLGCILNVSDPAAYIGVRAWVGETEGDTSNPYAVSPLSEDCDPDGDPYTVIDYEACHLSFKTACCLNE